MNTNQTVTGACTAKRIKIPTQREWSIERTLYGFWSIATMFNGHLVGCRYAGYTKREAMKQFRIHLLAQA